ncbi:MAG: manganese-binding transcriptional regulator MntR [Phycisphaeraceae bacterium]|nr:manganese-binding transcriptional regulator MntR [Phycisphaeraceae bacterium]
MLTAGPPCDTPEPPPAEPLPPQGPAQAPRQSARRRPAGPASWHSRTRQAHALETAEDYVEAIDDLQADQGEARVVELARRLGVSHVTVVRAIARLGRAGLVTARPYRAIFLTDAGKRLAERVRRRHQVVVQLLIAVGVPEEIARADAEGIEHHVSKPTLAAFERFVETRAAQPVAPPPP